jgi:hypothetical protein
MGVSLLLVCSNGFIPLDRGGVGACRDHSEGGATHGMQGQLVKPDAGYVADFEWSLFVQS